MGKDIDKIRGLSGGPLSYQSIKEIKGNSGGRKMNISSSSKHQTQRYLITNSTTFISKIFNKKLKNI
jgi:hypothetical protein